jgi:hypothetical protein
MNELFDPSKPGSWQDLRPNSTVTLRDEQTVQEMLDAGDADVSLGRDYFVKSVIDIREINDAAEWILVELDSPRDEDRIWLSVKVAGDELALNVCFSADGFDPGNRRDMLDREFYWLFDEPTDLDNYRLTELVYASRLRLPVLVGEEEREVDFEKIGGAEFHGRVRLTPPEPRMSEMMATVAEYLTTAAVPNPRVMIFEVGRPGNEFGGNIMFLQGAGIRTSEVDVLPVG